ncbi:HDHD2 [Cordylochernes scorpioides]|uniref:Immediate early response 3-interacting protein 1 n=1 Tax=Cordylochernes scorpioides TaxID=51811 RepID=A0ABY6KY35_9ARAC|nr:HDHD2 [Cordylochernes scorpioides]
MTLHREDMLCPVGWGRDQAPRGFHQEQSVKSQLLNLVHSIRTVMRTINLQPQNILLTVLTHPLMSSTHSQQTPSTSSTSFIP